METILGALVGSLALIGPLVFLVYVVVVAIVLINDRRDPTKTLPWLLLIYIPPGLGLVMYFFLGRNFRKKTLRSGWCTIASSRPTGSTAAKSLCGDRGSNGAAAVL